MKHTMRLASLIFVIFCLGACDFALSDKSLPSPTPPLSGEARVTPFLQSPEEPEASEITGQDEEPGSAEGPVEQADPFEPIGAWFSDPIVVGETVYVASAWYDADRGSDSFIYALDSRTGQLRWRFMSKGASSHLIATSNRVYFSNSQRIYALDSQNGEIIWETAVASNPLTLSLVDGVLYMGYGRFLRAVDSQTGQLLWEGSVGNSIESEILAAGAFLYFAGGNRMIALDSQSRQPVWQFETESRPLSPVLSGSVLFFGSADRHLYGVESETGEQVWKFQILGSFMPVGYPEPTEIPDDEVGEGSIAFAPGVFDEVVYVGSDDYHLYAIDAQTGHLRWRFKTGGAVTQAANVAGELVYFGSDDGNLYALNRQTGQLVWQFSAGGTNVTAPAISGTSIFAGSSHGYLYAVEAESGQVLWRFESDCSFDGVAC